MKLYATTTSERASKGQGGNKYLEIEIKIIDKVHPAYYLRVNGKSIELLDNEERSLYIEDHRSFPTVSELSRGYCMTCNNIGWIGPKEKCLNCNPKGIYKGKQ